MDLSEELRTYAAAFGNAAQDATISYARMWADHKTADLTARHRPRAPGAADPVIRPGLTVTTAPAGAVPAVTSGDKIAAILSSPKAWAVAGVLALGGWYVLRRKR